MYKTHGCLWAVTKGSNNTDVDQGKDKSPGPDDKKSLVRETQVKSTRDGNPFAVENLGHAFNKIVASATGAKIEDVADALSPQMVERLHQGKLLDEKQQANQSQKAPPLSPGEQESLNDYRKFKNQISRQIPLFEHNALMETLDARIAERAAQKTAPAVSKSADVTVPKQSDLSRLSENSLKSIETHQTLSPTHDRGNKAAPQAREISEHKDTTVNKANKDFNGDLGRDRGESRAKVQKGADANIKENVRANTRENLKENFKENLKESGSSKLPLSGSGPVGSSKLTEKGAVETAGHKTVSEKTVVRTSPDERSKGQSLSSEKVSGEKVSGREHVQLKFIRTDSASATEKLSTRANGEVALQRGAHPLSEHANRVLASHNCVVYRTMSNHPAPNVADKSLGESRGRSDSDVKPLFVPAIHKAEVFKIAGINYSGHTSLQDAFNLPGNARGKVVADEIRAQSSRSTERHMPLPGYSSISREGREILQTPIPNKFDSPIVLQKAQHLIELKTNVSLKIDGQKKVVLPISNLLFSTRFLDAHSLTKSPGAINKFESLQKIEPGVRAPTVSALSSARLIRRGPASDSEHTTQSKEFVVSRAQVGQRRYVLGTEIALVAVLAVAGITKARNDRLIPQNFGNQDVPRPDPNPALPVEKVDVKSQNEEVSTITESVRRRVHRSIESFAVPRFVLEEVRANKERFLSDSETVIKKILLDKSSDIPNAPRPLYRPIILVELNDTLQSIAEKYFHDVRIAWLIADLNSGNVREDYVDSTRIVSLQSRQALTLPVWADIESFYQGDLSNLKIEQLVTVVESSQIDVELYSHTFSNVIEKKST